MKKINVFILIIFCCVHLAWTWKQSKDQEFMQKGYEAWKIGNYNEAIVNYQNAIDIKPKNIDAYNFLGVIYEEIGYPKKAEEKYLIANRLDSNYLPVYLNLGLLYWNQGDVEKAIYYFQKRVEKGLANDPWTQKAMNALKTLRLQQKYANNPNFKESSDLELKHEKEPQAVETNPAYNKRKQQRDALINSQLDQLTKKMSDSSVEKEQLSPEAKKLYQQGLNQVSSGKYEDAIKDFDKALKLAPGTPEIVKARVDAFLQWKQQAMNPQ